MKSPIKILLVTYHFESTHVGPHHYAKMLYRLNENENIDIHILSEDLSTETDLLHKVELKFRWPLNKISYLWRSIIYYRSFLKLEDQFDIIIHNNVFTSFFHVWKDNKQSKIGAIAHDYFLSSKAYTQEVGFKQYFLNSVYRILESYSAKRLDFIWFCSNYVKQSLIENYHLKQNREYLTLYPSLKTRQINRSNLEIKKQVKVLFLKHDFKRGGLSDVIKAMGMLPEIQFDLVVAGPPENAKTQIKIIVGKFQNINLDWRGYVKNENVAELMLHADIFCMPSKREAFGITLIEAMANKVPVVTSDIGGIPEATGGEENVWIAKVGDIASISRKLKACIDQSSEREIKSNNAFKYIEAKFSQKKTQLQLLQSLANQMGHQK